MPIRPLGGTMGWISIIGSVLIGTFVSSSLGHDKQFTALMQFVVMALLLLAS